MYTIRKKYRVEYAHQLKSAYSKACSDTIHGHSGVVELFIESENLNKDQMVVDFGEISSLVKSSVMEFDHALIIPDSLDFEYIECLKKYNKKLIITEINPTAEVFAKMIFDYVSYDLVNYSGFRLVKVRFHETESGYAEYSE